MPVLRAGEVFRESCLLVFPLKNRGFQLLGGAPAAEETSPQTQSQDVEATQPPAEREPRPDPSILLNEKYKPGAFVPKDEFDPARVPKGYE